MASSSSSYDQFTHFRIPLKEIVSATNKFSDENLIEGSHELGRAYKGQLLHSEKLIDIVAQRFDHEHRHGDVEFSKEISALSTLKHKNLVSMVGFCDESGKMIIYKHDAINGSLDSVLKDPTLTWMRRLQICVGVAHALSYIHYEDGRDFSVIHNDIRSSKILLDVDWEAKLSGFELSLNQTADRRNNLCFTDVCGTRGYRDPAFDKTGSVTDKSDMYSFGVVLFEVLCGKKAVDEDNRLLAPFAKSNYEGGKLDEMIDPGLRKQMDGKSFQIFSKIAFCCLKEQRSLRPNVGLVAMELEKALESQREHEDRLRLKASLDSTALKNFKGNDMKHLEIPLIDIKAATKNFAKEYLIGSGTYGDVYKVELDHFDSKCFLPLEEEFDNRERSKKRSTVAIKHIKIRQDQQGEKGFYAEIEMLTSCKHPNIISLLGFCKEDSHMILVYEYASNGSLQTYMGNTDNLKYLTWKQRIKICLDIARGLNYLHTKIEDERRIIHRDIKGDNILLSENWEAKISDFGLSRFRPENQEVNTFYTNTVAGTDYYLDPEYDKTGKLNNKTDIYSFGVVLFEMLSGRLANDTIYINENSNGIAHVARRRFNDTTIKEMVDPRLWKETNGESFTLTKGPNRYALHAYLEIAYQCVAETQVERPTAKAIIKKLEEASSFQEGNLEHLEIPLSDILSATESFAKTYLIGSGTNNEMYKAELDHFDSKRFLSFEKKNQGDQLPKKRSIVAIKRILTKEDKQEEKTFLEEIEMLSSCKHPNIVSLLGFCEEGGHMILVYEYASNGSLDNYLGSTRKLINLSWAQRIKICIDIARGLNYLYTKIDDDLRMIHFDIKSSNILLGENWEAKIAGFELSKIHPQDQHLNSFYSKNIATQVYLDSKYGNMSELKNDTSIYSFGVVLFEVLSGRFANDPIYTNEDSNGIVPIACRHFLQGTIREMIDPKLMEETHVNTLYKGPGEDSLDAFSKIAYQCVTEHPTVEVIVKKLEEALSFQENIKDHLKFSLEYILLATQNFSHNNLIGEGGFGSVYIGEVTSTHGDVYITNTIVVKRMDRSHYKGDDGFLEELQTLFEYKHENIIGVLGYCIEKGENIIVYEYARRGRLDKYLKDNDVTWVRRLQICIDIATGLEFLHAGRVTQEVAIHKDMKTYNVLLDDGWKAKVSAFGVSLIRTVKKEMNSSDQSLVTGTVGYVDPLYKTTGVFTKESDIYSFGVVLFEILSGRLVIEYNNGQQHDLSHFFKSHYVEDKVDEIVFEGIKEQIAPKSLTTFVAIAHQCLHLTREERPTTAEVLLQLKKALEFQEDYEMWEPKLPNAYNEIISGMSNSQDIYSTEKKKDLYDILSKGILLQQSKVLFSLGGNGENNEMISARKFSYKNRWLYKWRFVPESRFPKVAEMLDVSNLKIQIKIKPQFLSPGTKYGVHLVFRFCGPRKSLAKGMYVNLKYKKGSEILHSYFAKWRDDGWMMIELYRFKNHKEDAEFECLLESFSRCYCGSRAIYVEGIEFRAIDNVKHEESNNLKEVQQVEKVQQILPTNFEKLLSKLENNIKSEELNNVNKKKLYMLSAKNFLYRSSDVKLFNSRPSSHSRFHDVIELQRNQVFCIKCKIEGQRLLPNTKYGCYLVFKLSEKCPGLHCPVIVRDLLHRKNKKKRIIYFRSPSPRNVNDNDRVPEERDDGWMEVNMWQFNSSNELRDDHVSINLKMISYEGTMYGLIVRRLEFRST